MGPIEVPPIYLQTIQQKVVRIKGHLQKVGLCSLFRPNIDIKCNQSTICPITKLITTSKTKESELALSLEFIMAIFE